MNENIAKAFVKAQTAFGPALKTSANPFYKSKYADLSIVIEAVIDALHSNDIALIQNCHESSDGVIVETIFLHTSGECISCGKLSVPAAKNDPQGYGSALTYARRYSLMAACGIAPEDDDGNAASRATKINELGNISSAKTPLAGALDNFNPEQIETLKEKATEIVDFATKERWEDAYATYDNIDDNEERVAVWYLLGPNKSIRSKIKAMGEQKRQSQKEAA